MIFVAFVGGLRYTGGWKGEGNEGETRKHIKNNMVRDSTIYSFCFLYLSV